MRISATLLCLAVAYLTFCSEISTAADGATMQQIPDCDISDNPIEFSWDNRPLWRTDMRAATDTVPAVVEVTAQRAMIVRISRWSRTFEAPVSLVVFTRVGEVYQGLCKVDRKMLGRAQPLAAIVIELRDDAPRTFRIEVFDHGSGGPTGDPPYTVEVQIDHRPLADVPLLPATVLPVAEPLSGGDCEFVSGPVRPQAELEPIRSERIVPLSEGSVYVSYQMAGRHLYFRLDRPKPFEHFVKLRVFSKSAGEQPFNEVCSVDLSTWPAGSDYALASIKEERIFNPIWRVEIVVEPGAATEDALTFSIFREHDPEKDEQTFAGAPYGSRSLLNSFVCQSMAGRGVVATRAAIPFAISSILKIKTVDGTGMLTENARATLRSSLLEAVALWRRSCGLCLAEHMLFVEIDKELYTIGQDGGFAAEALFEKEPVRLSIPRAGDPVLPTLPTERSGSRTGTMGYVTIARSNEVISRLCSTPVEHLSSTAAKVKAELCEMPQTQTVALPTIELVILDRPTSCGDGPNIVACEPDGKRVEFNGRDYRFRSWDTGEVLFGTGPKAVDLFPVLIHEVGHWIGLRHSAGRESIMAGSLQDARCIDNSTRDDLRRLAQGGLQTETGLKALTYFRSD